MQGISFVIPVYNNAATLPQLTKLLQQVTATLGEKHEIIFVNDASTDHSLQTAIQLATEMRNIRVLNLSRNQGQSVALICGLNAAKFSVSICMDADLQDPPSAIPLLLKKMETSAADVVFAGRAGKYESGGRHITARIFKNLFSLFTFKNIPASAGLFFAIRTTAAKKFWAFGGSSPYVLALMHHLRLKCAVVNVQRNGRPGGGSGYSTLRRWKTGLRGLLSVWQSKPVALPAECVEEYHF